MYDSIQQTTQDLIAVFVRSIKNCSEVTDTYSSAGKRVSVIKLYAANTDEREYSHVLKSWLDAETPSH